MVPSVIVLAVLCLSASASPCGNAVATTELRTGGVVLTTFFNNSSFNVPRLAARRRTGMTWEGQRICRLMHYLTPRVVSPPRTLLVVESRRRVPAYNYNKTYTQNKTPS
jgi:hypothetical protein